MGRNGQVTEEQAKLSGRKGFGDEIFPAALSSVISTFGFSLPIVTKL